MKRRELMAIVAVAAGLSSAMSTTTHAYAGQKGNDRHDNGPSVGFELKGHWRGFDFDFDHWPRHPGHFIGHGHFHHGHGHGWGHHHHDHDIY
jgi:hypothetical protein